LAENKSVFRKKIKAGLKAQPLSFIYVDLLLYLGCAVWAYKNWIGEFYPKGSRAGEFLGLYGQRLNTVEGNTTFYSVPNGAMVDRWAAATPESFRFCLKLPRSLTHTGELREAIGGAQAFLERMAPLGPRLGPVFAQLPPTYAPDRWRDLLTFLEAWPHERVRLALEVRHPAWFQAPSAESLNRHLVRLGVGRVLLDTRPIYRCEDDPQVHSERRKPDLPLQPVVTTDFAFVRFISHPERDRNREYLREWADRVAGWLREGLTVYYFVHCPQEEQSPGTTRAFHKVLARVLEERGLPGEALPWEAIAESPPQAQLRLF
jgi:uncharacterized protein YecE (DUF72 family)